MIDFRFACKEDFPTFRRMSAQVHALHAVWRPEIFRQTEEPIPMDLFAERCAKQEILLACMENEPIGYAAFSVIERNFPMMFYRKVLDLDNLCIEEAFRGKGVGKQLLLRLMQHGKALGCTELQLTCDPMNEAGKALYTSVGMQPISIKYKATLCQPLE